MLNPQRAAQSFKNGAVAWSLYFIANADLFRGDDFFPTATVEEEEERIAGISGFQVTRKKPCFATAVITKSNVSNKYCEKGGLFARASPKTE